MECAVFIETFLHYPNLPWRENIEEIYKRHPCIFIFPPTLLILDNTSVYLKMHFLNRDNIER